MLYKSIMFFVFFIPSYVIASNVKSPEVCIDIWDRVNDVYFENNSYDEVIEIFRVGADEKCKSTGFYFLKLGWLAVLNSDFELGLNSFDQGIALKSGYVKQLKLAKADYYFQLGAKQEGEQQKIYLIKSEAEYKKLIENIPNFYDAYNKFTGLLLVLGKYEQVIQYGKLALEGGEYEFSYRNLTISYQKLNQYMSAITSMKKAFSLNKDIFGDTDFMLATALSYSSLGKFEHSLKVLQKLVELKPKAINEDDFQNVAKYIRNEVQKKETKK